MQLSSDMKTEQECIEFFISSYLGYVNEYNNDEFITHSLYVYTTLKSMCAPSEICLAGLFHCAYGTDEYVAKKQISRSDVLEYLGETAADIVNTYNSIASKDQTILKNLFNFDNRKSRNLQFIHYANLLSRSWNSEDEKLHNLIEDYKNVILGNTIEYSNTIKKLDSICIVGGGTAGWLSAAYLSNNNPNLNITIVDKKDSSPVSVGEATILNFSSFMDKCGFDTNEWFSSIDATYKSGILFPNWAEDGKDVWHPFFVNPTLENGETCHDAWCKNKNYDFVKYGLPLYETSLENKVDKNIPGAYAYHIDCGKLIEYIKSKLISKINFIESEVNNVEKNNTNVEKLILKNGNEITSDLFVDCSGWNSLLKEQDQVNLYGRLFCNTAIATRVPYEDRKTELKPYVISESIDCGWIWKIPVRTRIGSGIVFNREITPIEEAKKYFIEYWNGRISEKDLKVLDWTPQYSNNIWEGNVVSIGLSAGFIEPLESTGLALMIDGLLRLQNKIGDKSWSFSDSEIYNKEMKFAFEDCIDFVSMHYSKPYKNTDFWNHVKQNYTASERINFIENTLSEKVLYMEDRKDCHIFSGSNWTTWMIQLGYDVNTSSKCSSSELELNMVRQYERNEKFRPSWSVDHETDISRIELYYDLKND